MGKFRRADFPLIAEYICDEHTRRKGNRRDLEKQWEEIDRQIAMVPDNTYKKSVVNNRVVMDPDKRWLPEIELPLQAQSLEVLTADARRMLFPDAGPWFTAHCNMTDEYLDKVDFQAIISGAIYKISKLPGLYITNNLFYTHAWLPKDQFDEAREENGWIFVRKNDGYLALRSQHLYRWVHDLSLGGDQMAEAIAPIKANSVSSDPDDVNEIIVEGDKNIWICELGCQDADGEFTRFVQKICEAELQFDILSVKYESPSLGWLEFGWEGPFIHSGEVIHLDQYPRYDNPFCRADFWSEEIHIHCQDKALRLDWETGERRVIGGEI